ncbi:MAG: hypothetical protein IJC02_13335 [Lachnospiraceae bacterium]|nr:hypothetical protein [Lachnospiraceae bacterium]
MKKKYVKSAMAILLAGVMGMNSMTAFAENMEEIGVEVSASQEEVLLESDTAENIVRETVPHEDEEVETETTEEIAEEIEKEITEEVTGEIETETEELTEEITAEEDLLTEVTLDDIDTFQKPTEITYN